MRDISLFKFYSLGIVVRDLIRGEDTIIVSPIEHLNVQPNDKLDSPLIENIGTLDSPINKNSFRAEIKSSDNIIAKWINFGSGNRITPPNVYKGETVAIYKYGYVDEYYWNTIFREPELRKQETVVTAYSNEKQRLKEYNTNTSYWHLVDTIGKRVQFHTSKNDNEPVAYDTIMDTRKGTYEIFKDSNGNYMLLNSVDKTLKVYVLEQIELIDQSGDFIKIKNGSNSIEIVGGRSVTITSNNVTINSRITTITGDLNITGNVNSGNNHQK